MKPPQSLTRLVLASYLVMCLFSVTLCASVRSNTCCSSTSTSTSVEEFNLRLRDAVGEVRKVLLSRTQKFDEFFKALLKTSKRDFHTMFLQTYGLLYERNSFIFTDMFQKLEKYYMNGGVELNQVLDDFFHKLYSKMFQVLNAQYVFDQPYLDCVSKNMEDLKPFGDIPKKLKIEVKRSFVATRTFVQAMNSGAEVLAKVMDISVSRDCFRHLQSVVTCTQCETGHTIPACESTCVSSASRCLSLHSEMNPEWDNYVNQLMLLSSRLETSFNIESVVDPIDIKISEAIMNFQENGIAVSQKLFDACGKPRIGKRAAMPGSGSLTSGSLRLPVDNYRYSRPSSGLAASASEAAGSPHSASGSAGASIDRLLLDIKRKVKKTKDYWTTLSHSLCRRSPPSSSLSSSPSSSTASCFNGTQVIIESSTAGASALTLSASSGGNQRRGVPSSPHSNHLSSFSSESNANMRQQIVRLKAISIKLTNAYNGLDVEWNDANEASSTSSSISSSSSWSEDDLFQGSGSGKNPYKDDDEERGRCLDDDDEEDDCDSDPRLVSSSTEVYPFKKQTDQGLYHTSSTPSGNALDGMDEHEDEDARGNNRHSGVVTLYSASFQLGHHINHCLIFLLMPVLIIMNNARR